MHFFAQSLEQRKVYTRPGIIQVFMYLGQVCYSQAGTNQASREIKDFSHQKNKQKKKKMAEPKKQDLVRLSHILKWDMLRPCPRTHRWHPIFYPAPSILK